MRILVWNINMAAHKKVALLQQLAPDLAILPECAAPEVILTKCPSSRSLMRSGWNARVTKVWVSFSFGDVRITRSPVFDPRFEVFLPLRVTGPNPLSSACSLGTELSSHGGPEYA
jgi:hypothetical protein